MSDTFALLASVSALHLAAAVSPGPNFMLVTHTSISRSRRAGLVTALGIATGAVVWVCAALLGVNLVLERLPWAFTLIKVAGGVYLIYLGVRMWLTKAETHKLQTPVDEHPGQLYRKGLFTNLSNPKSAVFFSSIFAVSFTPGIPYWVKLAAGGIMVFNALWWHCLVALLFSDRRIHTRYGRAKRGLDRVLGTLLAGFGVKLLLSGR